MDSREERAGTNCELGCRYVAIVNPRDCCLLSCISLTTRLCACLLVKIETWAIKVDFVSQSRRSAACACFLLDLCLWSNFVSLSVYPVARSSSLSLALCVAQLSFKFKLCVVPVLVPAGVGTTCRVASASPSHSLALASVSE
eukprot:scaffold9386_cov106-Isochrysis_galbana.AAC.2